MKRLKALLNMANKYSLATDIMLTLVIAALAFFVLRAYWALQPIPVHVSIAVILVTLEIIPLALRRVFPSATLLIVTAAALTLEILRIPEMNFVAIVSIIAIFSAAAYGGRWRNIACAVSIANILGTVVYTYMFSGSVFPINRYLLGATSLLLNLLMFVLIWWFGNTLRTNREQTLKLKESTELLTQEREDNARRAVFEERVRIARELHDVLAHHVSVMGIQAGAARQVFNQYPEKALNSLSLIETSSRQAVAELYRLLGLLRDEGQAETFMAQPGLHQLDKLVADMHTSGLQVEVKIEGEKREIPQTVDLSAYRIIEEALTNTLKHAGPATATVAIDYQKNALLLEISDNGKGAEKEKGQSNGGKGLIGMRERVKLLKGEFWAGSGLDGGFRVNAKLPLSG